jgi:isoleucyl-tRNA synthetase
MDAAIRVVSQALTLREAHQLRVRLPLDEMIVVPADDVQGRGVLRFQDHILDELNIKAIRVCTDGLAAMSDPENWAIGGDRGLTLALRTLVTPALEREGLSRDLVRHIQQMRKQADLDLSDHVEVVYDTADEVLLQALRDHADYIRTETQCTALLAGCCQAGKQIRLSGHEIQLGIRKA